MNDEILKLKLRIAELERINEELMRENSALKGGTTPKKETQTAQQGADISTRILQCCLESRQPLMVSQIANRFNLSQSAAQYHVDHLVTNGFLTLSRAAGGRGSATGYALTPQGRAVVTGAAS